MIALNEIIRQYPEWMQKPAFFDQMVKEYLHHIMLRLIFTCKNSDRISFIGGTALRYFYNLKRFSEDLDFDCFDLRREQFNEITGKVEKGLQAQGYDVLIEDKKKYEKLKAFRRVFVFRELKFKLGISQQKEAKFFIKIEAEPHGFNYKPQVKSLNGFGVSTFVNTMPLNLMFSSKIAAAINRSKDRDFFDIITLIDFAVPDFSYLNFRCNINNSEQLKKSILKAAEKKKLDTRKVYDCEHMIFEKRDIEKLRSFTTYIESIDFSKFDSEIHENIK